MDYLLNTAALAALALAVGSSVYQLAAIRRLRAFGRQRPATRGYRPPVTVLKPVCGPDEGLHENLASFCDQDYPDFQVVFGARDAADPALAVVRRVMAERPGRDLALVVDDRVHGTNLKISNLENMWHAARHDVVVVADSDMRVGPDYLEAIVAPFEDPRVGAVTCLYRGRPAGGLASTLACLFINEWFLPSVLVSVALRELDFCLGATMAVRRRALEEIGGLGAIGSHLADDHMLGRLVRARGYRVELSPYVVDDVVRERGLAELFRHELRWTRTVRGVAPWGHAFSFVMYVFPLALLAALALAAVGAAAALAWTLVAIALALRLALHRTAGRVLGPSGRHEAWLLPVRDLLSLAVWAASFLGRRVSWRDQILSVRSDGRIGRPSEVTTG